MEQPRRSSRLRSSEVCYDERRAGRLGRRPSRISAITADSREGLGMKVIAVRVERYRVLPRELWDLNSISDMGAGRGITYDENVSKAMLERITSNKRYNIVNLTIKKKAHSVSLPDTLRRLDILVETYNYPLNLPSTLQELKFTRRCNHSQPLVLPDALRKLQLAYHYNRPIVFPPSLVELELGVDYTQHLVLPQCLKRLDFPYNSRFNLPVALPSSLSSVQFGDSYNQATILPNGIEEIRVGYAFTHDLSLPSSLRKISWWCSRPIEIPEGVSEVSFGVHFSHPVVFPTSLKKVSFAFNYSCPLDFPNTLEELTLYHHYDGLVLPQHLQKLTWGSAHAIQLPLGLKELVIVRDAPLVLPEGLLKVTLTCGGQRHYDLPESVQEVVLTGCSRFAHPDTLQHLILGYGVNNLDLSNHKIQKLSIKSRYVNITHWPQGLMELEFTVDVMSYTLRVPEGVRIVGEKRPANVIVV